jgi:uncharacterized protein
VTTPEQAADEILVLDNTDQRRYDLYVGEARAGFADYHSQPGLITIMDTQIEPAFEGQGIGSEFIRGVLDDIRRQDAKVLPVCPFVRSFLQRHPEYGDLVWKP